MLKKLKGVVNSKLISAYDIEYCETSLELVPTIQIFVL